MRLMIVEDDVPVANCLKEYFELSGFECEVFNDPREGVGAYKLGDYEVVLTDIKMPGMNGIEVLEAIRSRDPRAHVIIMTGFADVNNAINAVNAGAYAFFRKPLEMDKLKACLQRIERERQYGRRENDLGEELVKLCLELQDFERSIDKDKYR